MAALDAQDEERRQAVRQLLIEKGRLDVLAEFDKKISDIRMGIDGARSTWNALSKTQRRLLMLLSEGGYVHRRSLKHRFTIHGKPDSAKYGGFNPLTVRNLLCRELLDWAPGLKIILTEKGRFVLRHGQSE